MTMITKCIVNWELHQMLMEQKYGKRKIDIDYKTYKMITTTENEITSIRYESDFIDTAGRETMKEPMGTIPYLETEYHNPKPGDECGTAEVKVYSKFVEAKTFRFTAKYRSEIVDDLKAFGIDGNRELLDNLATEGKQRAEASILKKYIELAQKNADNINTNTRWKRFLYNTLKIKPVRYVNEKDLGKTLVSYSNLIANISRRGYANFAVVNSSIASFLQDHPGFVYLNPGDVSMKEAGSIYCIGSIFNIKFFVNPWMKHADTRILLGRTTNENNPGVYYLEHSKEITRSEDGPESQYHLLDRSALVDVGYTPHTSYFIFTADFGKKPLWRKILGL